MKGKLLTMQLLALAKHDLLTALSFTVDGDDDVHGDVTDDDDGDDIIDNANDDLIHSTHK